MPIRPISEQTYVDPIDIHLATDANGPPLLAAEAMDRLDNDHRQFVEAERAYDKEDWEDEDDEPDDDDSEIDDPSELDTEAMAPHVVMHQTKQGPGVKCEHCGESFAFVLPVKLTNWCALGKAFAGIHAKCKPRKAAK